MTKLITEELVEKAARAMWDLSKDDRPEWEKLSPHTRETRKSYARAALSAVLPDIIEECAKVAEYTWRDTSSAFSDGEIWVLGKAADNIRALGKE